MLSIVFCIQKFQSDIFNKKFLFHVDCKSAKFFYKKMFKILYLNKFLLDIKLFYFEIEFIK